MGKLVLLPAEHSDADEILAGQLAAFSKPVEPFFDILFPEAVTEKKELAVKRTLDWWLGDESARYMKVVDEESGAIVSAAKWCIYEKPLTEEQMNEHITVDWHSDADTNDWSSHVIHSIHSHRLARTNGAICCVLDMLSTHPSHQGRGAGKMLVNWGCAIADEINVEAFIEGTAIARHLYESCGFVATPDEWVYVDVPDQWRGRPKIKYYFMERAARGKPAKEEVV